MKAVNQKKVDLDADINTYLPFKVEHPKYPQIPITLRHLSNHTSGINDGEVYLKSYIMKDMGKAYANLTSEIEEHVSMMKNHERIDDSELLKNALFKEGKWYSEKNFTKKEPGKKFHYSNMGSALAAYVIENAVGMSYEDFTKEFIFKPLEMLNTGWTLDNMDKETFVTRYFTKEMPIPDYDLITKADGALITNTDDFGKFLIEMVHGYNGNSDLLSDNAFKLMFTRKEIGNESSGIFWGVDKHGQPNHSGSDPGVLTNMIISPHKNLGVFIMMNTGSDYNSKVMPSLFKIWNSMRSHKW